MLMGPFVGGLFVVMLPFFLDRMADFASILKGVVLILVLIFAPAGICEVVARPFRALRRRKLMKVGRMPEPRVGQAVAANR
jgi:hypothetical protein